MPISNVTSDSGYNATQAQGIDSRDLLGQKLAPDCFLGLQFPRICHLKSHWILLSRVAQLAVPKVSSWRKKQKSKKTTRGHSRTGAHTPKPEIDHQRHVVGKGSEEEVAPVPWMLDTGPGGTSLAFSPKD